MGYPDRGCTGLLELMNRLKFFPYFQDDSWYTHYWNSSDDVIEQADNSEDEDEVMTLLKCYPG